MNKSKIKRLRSPKKGRFIIEGSSRLPGIKPSTRKHRITMTDFEVPATFYPNRSLDSPERIPSSIKTEPKKKVKYPIKRNEKKPSSKKMLYNTPPVLKELNAGYSRILFSIIVKDTPKAVCLLIKGSNYWFPKSQIKIGLNPQKTSHAVDIPNWIFKQKPTLSQ